MSDNLPENLQPTAADIARDRELAAEAKAILGEIEKESGHRVKVNTQSYSSVQYGADGSIVSRIENDVPLQTPEQEAVAKAQSAANAELMRIESDIARLVAQRDEITGYDTEGNPKYFLPERDRQQLERRIRHLRLGLVNQKRLNERKWRKEAAERFERQQELQNEAQKLAKELEAKGRVQRIPGW
ncbi:hypothetical protein [Erythrobacter sp.]|uniref:hypothetical protein n=1 Tax=Erythrobacter sp. TaxID=1042 RepID=UPI001425CBB5|nr:hypothetical protein [Erythrobacter sp.]QIQ87077.1 MAG: hypothetical protein G9473_10560 [Erythrobacter sp.]